VAVVAAAEPSARRFSGVIEEDYIAPLGDAVGREGIAAAPIENDSTAVG
jgi:hypothetical protein